ncbi:MAG: transposase [Methylobacter sp.]|nr:transposase [Methylobacter sp.]
MITQIAFSDNLNPGKFAALTEQAERLGVIRSEVWQRFGSINGVGLRDRTIRDNWLKQGKPFNVGATPWKQTLCDAIGDIKACREAAKFNVKQAIRRHSNDKDEQKRLYTLLKSDNYRDDRYLSRIMRKYYQRGHNHTYNQIIVRSDDYTVFVLAKKVWIKIPSLIKGKRIAIPLSTRVAPKGNLRINNKVEVHYAADMILSHDCGGQTIGVDKGYTEVLTDSDGVHHGVTLGAVLTKESDRLKLKYQRRNKLKAIAKKKPWVTQHNLGRKKLDKQAVNHQSSVRTLVHEAVNHVIDKAAVIVTEDLTSPIAGKKFSKNVSRRLSAWTKGVIAHAIENASRRRGSTVVYINAAYTSQMDSCDGSLSGKRCGEKFYRENGEVLQADVNAARNVLARLHDSEIGRWTPYKQVKSILLKRNSANRLKLLNQDSSCRLKNLSTESELLNAYV